MPRESRFIVAAYLPEQGNSLAAEKFSSAFRTPGGFRGSASLPLHLQFLGAVRGRYFHRRTSGDCGASAIAESKVAHLYLLASTIRRALDPANPCICRGVS